MNKEVNKQSELQQNENFLVKIINAYRTNEKVVNITTGVVLVLVVVILGYFLWWSPQRQAKAELAIYKAEQYFAMDSTTLALNGDGSCVGLIDVIKQYPCTKTAKRARFMAGACYLKQGQYDEAISYLKKFSSNDKILPGQALCMIGDAYMEKSDISQAAKYYQKASKKNPNDLLTSLYLYRYALACEMQGSWKDAIVAYEQIQKEYPQSYEATLVEKRIAYAKTQK